MVAEGDVVGWRWWVGVKRRWWWVGMERWWWWWGVFRRDRIRFRLGKRGYLRRLRQRRYLDRRSWDRDPERDLSGESRRGCLGLGIEFAR